jgi:hypothetical protein
MPCFLSIEVSLGTFGANGATTSQLLMVWEKSRRFIHGQRTSFLASQELFFFSNTCESLHFHFPIQLILSVISIDSIGLSLSLPLTDFLSHRSNCGEASQVNSYPNTMMLRSTATRSLLKGFAKVPAARSSYNTAPAKLRNAAPLCQLNNKRPKVLLSLSRPTTISLLYATKSPYDPLDPKQVKEILESKIEPHPDDVSAGSSVRHVFEGSQAEKKEEDAMLGGIKADIETIKDTFALTEVPKESLYFGAAGVIPYAATSLSTAYLAWDINHASASGQGVLFSPETAHQLLDMITPIQIGYGAVVRTSIHTHDLRAYRPADHLFPWRHPLGLGVCWIWRSSQLPPIHVWSRCASSCMANHFHASRTRLDHSILGLQLPLLRRRTSDRQRLVPTLVLHL